jgi:glycosyltransferase involved in cell wall biosynthesis
MNSIQVLLSTYNGEKYLRPLLDSVLAQDHPRLELLVRDDGSSDRTPAILQEYAAVSPRMRVFPGGHLGIAASFFQLLKDSSKDADFLAFSDQDDIWEEDKCSRAVEFLERCSPAVPALYCSRVAMVDKDLNRIRLSNIPPRGLSFQNALVESTVWGCTMVINQAARRLLLRRLPRHAWVHDRWIYLVVSALGVVQFDTESRILHRRHSTNTSTIPVTAVQKWTVQQKQFVRFGREQRVARQAQEFMDIYGNEVSAENHRILQRFLKSRERLLDRIRYALSCDVYHQSRTGHLMLRLLIGLDRLY